LRELRDFLRILGDFLKALPQNDFGAFHRLSTAPDRQITPQYTTFQQLPAHSPQVIHRFFLRSLIDTFVASGSTITLPQNLWQNLATLVREGDSASAVAQPTPDLANVFGLTDFYLD
jgi:hypothetical protein